MPGFFSSSPQAAEEDERYTTRETLAWCLKAAGVRAFDLDVAACREAHCAPRYYTKADNALVKPWHPRRNWCNPPWSLCPEFIERAWEQSRRCALIAMLMPGNRTEQPWWQKQVEPFRDRGGELTSRFLPGRTPYGLPGNPRGIGVGSPNFTSVLLVFARAKRRR